MDQSATFIAKQSMKQGQSDSQQFQPSVQPQQSSTKAIKKKSLLNFRAIKNNYVVKPANTGMAMVENEVSPKAFMANSAMAANAQGASHQRRNHGKLRGTHSQFSDDGNRVTNTGYMSQRAGNPPHGQMAGHGGQGPIDHGDPQRQSYAYSQERRPRMFETNSLNDMSAANAQQNVGPMEQSHQVLPNHGDGPGFIAQPG